MRSRSSDTANSTSRQRRSGAQMKVLVPQGINPRCRSTAFFLCQALDQAQLESCPTIIAAFLEICRP